MSETMRETMRETRAGRCLCGAVRFTAAGTGHELHACHCGMCRRWSGSAFVVFGASGAQVQVEGGEHIARYRSSDWAERCFCRQCGSHLWYHLTAPGAAEDHFIAAGLLDDLSGMRLATEIFIDAKPDAFAFAGETQQFTGAEFMASMSASPEE